MKESLTYWAMQRVFSGFSSLRNSLAEHNLKQQCRGQKDFFHGHEISTVLFLLSTLKTVETVSVA
jgi:hypothetical protein